MPFIFFIILRYSGIFYRREVRIISALYNLIKNYSDANEEGGGRRNYGGHTNL
jgi:hypothetical protein